MIMGNRNDAIQNDGLPTVLLYFVFDDQKNVTHGSVPPRYPELPVGLAAPGRSSSG